jgi:hypothetical protein
VGVCGRKCGWRGKAAYREQAAAPLMFDIFSQLDGQSWFQQPVMEMVSHKCLRKKWSSEYSLLQT